MIGEKERKAVKGKNKATFPKLKFTDRDYKKAVAFAGTKEELDEEPYLKDLFEGFKMDFFDLEEPFLDVRANYAMTIVRHEDDSTFKNEKLKALYDHTACITYITKKNAYADVDVTVGIFASQRISGLDNSLSAEDYLAMKNGRKFKTGKYKNLLAQKTGYRKFLSRLMDERPTKKMVLDGQFEQFVNEKCIDFFSNCRELFDIYVTTDDYYKGLFVKNIWDTSIAYMASALGLTRTNFSEEKVDKLTDSRVSYPKLKKNVETCTRSSVAVINLIKFMDRISKSSFNVTYNFMKIFYWCFKDGLVPIFSRFVNLLSDAFEQLQKLVSIETLVTLDNMLVYDRTDGRFLDADSTGYEGHLFFIIFGKYIVAVIKCLLDEIGALKKALAEARGEGKIGEEAL